MDSVCGLSAPRVNTEKLLPDAYLCLIDSHSSQSSGLEVPEVLSGCPGVERRGEHTGERSLRLGLLGRGRRRSGSDGCLSVALQLEVVPSGGHSALLVCADSYGHSDGGTRARRRRAHPARVSGLCACLDFPALSVEETGALVATHKPIVVSKPHFL